MQDSPQQRGVNLREARRGFTPTSHPALQLINSSDEPENTVEDSQRMGGTAGDVEVYGDVFWNAHALFVAGVGAAGYRAGAGGDNHLRTRHRVVRLAQGELHIPRDGTRHKNAVRMAR